MKARRRSTRLNNKNGRPMITDLPEPIVMDILSRLPVKTIINCWCVCKTWLHLLLDPHFAKIHLSRSPTQILLCLNEASFFMGELDELLLYNEKYGEKGIRVGRESMPVFTTFPPRRQGIDIFNVANGFFCLANAWKPCYIHNPISGEVIVVQQTRRKYRRPYMFGLGFSRQTNELKLIRIVGNRSYSSSERFGRLEADIYRASTNSWRSIGEASHGMLFNLTGPFVNGALHCKTNEIGNSIFLFDFEEEKFRTFRAPPMITEERDYLSGRLQLLEGYLCVSYRKRSLCTLDIWVMNEYGVEDSWTKRYVINNITEGLHYEPCRLMKNGEILLVRDKNCLIAYDPKGKSSRYIKFHVGRKHIRLLVFPFVPNFIRVQTKDQVED